MKNKNTPKIRKHNKTLTDAILKGALVWGPIYSVASSTAACGITDDFTISTYAATLAEALCIFPVVCMLGGASRWRIIHYKRKRGNQRKTTRPRNQSRRFSPGSHPFRWSPTHV